MQWINYGKHWRYFIRPDGYVEIICPTMHKGIEEFKLKKEVYKDFKELTDMILVNGYKGWIGNTKITFPNIMKMFVKVGAQPYFIDLQTENIFFVREVK
ncbi:MAG: hypothetical protein AB1478_02705 [Nitrospirota bacterium]